MDLNVVYQEDCVGPKGMCQLPDNSVDMILCDLPYGTTACSWDSVIPFDKLWEQYERVIKTTGCIALFGSEPFSSYLRMSKIDYYKYDWVWEKGRATGFLHAKNKPLKAHENISIFSKGATVHKSQSKNRMFYEPVMMEGKPYTIKKTQVNSGRLNHRPSQSNINHVETVLKNEGYRYPRSVLKFSMHNVGNINPTQKPVALFEYLIKTYTNEGAVVLDNCIGSGTTAIACLNTNRHYIGYENDPEMYIKMNDRILNHKNKG